jgi:ribosome-associated translation inhibitor RaiA
MRPTFLDPGNAGTIRPGRAVPASRNALGTFHAPATGMNLDIETEHVVMRSGWHRTIEEWVARSAKLHPDLASVDLTLRHDERTGDRVDAEARVGNRILRSGAKGEFMTAVLQEALAALERELLAVPRAAHAAGAARSFASKGAATIGCR